ncbi:MAG: hypothetical protein ACQESR_07735 [Planctomycetota bacterium]
MRYMVLVGAIVLSGAAATWSGEVQYVEDFVLAEDREAALEQLIPGTEDYYYWHCIHWLNTERYEQIDEMLEPWVRRHGETARVWEIRTRRALLSYERNPRESLEYLRHRFGIHYPHQKEELDAEPNLPTELNARQISRERFRQLALQRHRDSLNGFEDSALQWLIENELDATQRRQLLQRLHRPDYANVVQLVAADLDNPKTEGFGSLNIHRQLLKSQLDELLKLKPELLDRKAFVRAYLTKLQPNPDVDWRHDDEATKAYLERLQAFVQRLEPVHNSLKSHVLYHRLLFDRRQGTYDKDRFLAYIKLPRPTHYISKSMRESEAMKRFACDLSSNFDGATQLPPIRDDEALVRGYLAHFLVDAADTKEYEPFIDDVYLRHLFAETKIVHGLGDPEQWASLLPPELFRQLKERVDIDFEPTNKTLYAIDDDVSLTVHVKNVSTLLVKVFEINTENYYRETQQEVDTDINLDGLVANHEETYEYDKSPFRRVERHFAFPMLDKPGVYVIDFIGNGQSSRALIRKGQLRHLVETTPAGQSFTILDENNQQVNDARLWIAGHEYESAEDGKIDVPFTTDPGKRPVVITAPAPGAESATYSSLSSFHHEPESYQFKAGFYVDRESLLEGKTARLLIRPSVSINSTAASLKLLEKPTLTVTSTDLEDTSSTVEVEEFKLFEDRESVYEFQVPRRLARLQVRLSAKITQAVTGEKISVADEATFSLNGINRTDKIEDLHLLKADGKYVLEVLGRTGEPKGSRPVNFTFKHRDFRDTVHVVLKTNPDGRVKLGKLEGIDSLTAKGPEGTEHRWALIDDRHTYNRTVHARAGESIVLPYLGMAERVSRRELSLLQLTGGTFSVDRFDHLHVKNGLLVIEDLPPGDYDLLLKARSRRIAIRIAAGRKVGSFIVGKPRQLETPRLEPLQIESITPADEEVVVQLRNVSQFTRVHVYASRYMPEYDAYENLGEVKGPEPYMFRRTPAESVYLTGRNIGDEYRYIIDRRYATKYPGNMLARPSLLLNPWAVRDTETGEQRARGGDRFDKGGGRPDATAEREAAAAEQPAPADDHFADLDFLASSAGVLLNLRPDEKGVVEIPRDALGDKQHIRVVAVDPLNTTYRTLSLPEPTPSFVDLRLLNNLDPEQHFSQQKQITVVPAEQKFTLRDIATARFESYDSLASVFTLYATLSGSEKLAEFSFLLDWPNLAPEKKQELYSKYASHELNFFLFKKDPRFFKQVVQPYLEHKKDKTFMDHFLLGNDLSNYLSPWTHNQLNIVERILLARRIEGERKSTARHVRDLYALLPPDVERFNHLFNTAVQRSALAVDDGLGLRDAKEELQRRAVRKREGGATKLLGQAMDAPQSSAEPAPDAGPHPVFGLPGGKAGELADKARLQREVLEEKRKAASRRLEAAAAKKKPEKPAEGEEAVDEDAYFYGRDLERRERMRQLYRQLEKTKEWAENNYHHLTIDKQDASLISVNAFWEDFANHDPAQPFLSTHLAEASRNFPEMLLALAVLDVPFTAEEHKSRFEDNHMTLVPSGPVVLFHEEIKPAEAPSEAGQLLVSQNFFKQGDRYRTVNGEKVDKFVTEEFVRQTVYGCQIVITNPTSARQKLTVLAQVPKGAIPVLGGKATTTLNVDLEPYHTKTLEYHFYFPAAGQFPHFPVHVARNEQLVAAANPMRFNVVKRPTQIDTESWDYVSQYGSLEDVVQFLNNHNVEELNLERIAWRMHQKGAFERIIPLLEQRHVYNHTLWSYALKHNAVSAAQEYLRHADKVVNECGGPLESTLLAVDPVARHTYQHLEYKPLVNARAHALGQRRQIVNDRLHWQYHRFLKNASYHRSLDSSQLLAVTYYLLLQDRVGEALDLFARVNRDDVATELQYDYCAAYLKFFTEQPEKARAIAEEHVDHPVDRWRKTFATIVAQLDEATGKEVDVIDAQSRDQQQSQLAASEPDFDFSIEGRKIRLNHQNLDAVTVNFYEVDVELLFSRNPFVRQFGDSFASIKPNQSLEVALSREKPSTVVELPESLKTSNLLVEVVGAGDSKTVPHFSNSLSVQVIENYGQVKVTHSETFEPVSKAYVKVYARSGAGEVKFYKDGYTDLRGRFDYATLSTNALDGVETFSVLVLSDKHGAMVREAAPPKR